AEGFTEDDVDLVLWRNPAAFYQLSGRLELDVTTADATHEGNSILRGGE
ncbi:hydrolase TatD, partial [Streptomyces sp. NPDC048232]